MAGCAPTGRSSATARKCRPSARPCRPTARRPPKCSSAWRRRKPRALARPGSRPSPCRMPSWARRCAS
ncbi:hypothetical protein EOD42_14100 [Rhodovarius crocodyli]|uniref:Uncharacterized protein n=1 Tax=Rhodovarius crocodyli TaxID=1979269 RepID=A0A437MFJ2_9PROT|nr:hypothetical protein EOD42_14100 [Rhodovarius crocodyli]